MTDVDKFEQLMRSTLAYYVEYVCAAEAAAVAAAVVAAAAVAAAHQRQ